jgi:hypothetical protein
VTKTISSKLAISSKLFLVLVIALSAGCAPAVDLESIGRFQTAEEEFSASETDADFLRVASLYQEILDSGLRSGAVLYNQGNAFARAQEHGRALAAYRQSQRIRPRDPHLDANLRSCLSALGVPASKRSFWDHVFFWKPWLSLAESMWLATGLLAATLVSLLVLQAKPQRSSVVLGILTIIAGGSVAFDWYQDERTQHGIVVAETIARKGNSEGYAAAFSDGLQEGLEFVVLERRGDWLRIQLPGTGEGWIPSRQAVVY